MSSLCFVILQRYQTEPLPNSYMDRRNCQTYLSWSLRENRSVLGGNRIEQMLPRADGSPSYKFKWLSLAKTGLGVPDQGVYIVVVTASTNNRLS